MTAELRKKKPGDRIGDVGHRAFVGGTDLETWYGIGKLQYHFLVANGLEPQHRFLDIACGALRLGQYLIPYLQHSYYFGLDAHEELVRSGLSGEFFANIVDKKQPIFAFNSDFDFSFIEKFDVAIAQSLFTHLTREDIRLCFRNLRPHAHAQSRFWFTFFEGDEAKNPAGPSDANLGWYYAYKDLAADAAGCGWTTRLIGDWQHPRRQSIVLALPAQA
ncbi:hypothetical protein [Falsiroseomonas sp.]|uniref:hypothetical protein n=1 Tax=Falsiroseomonas sp. TaxID=2870721 RepID=UPI003568318E